MLDRIQDPGNLGTILRTASALGWEGAFLCEFHLFLSIFVNQLVLLSCSDVLRTASALRCEGALLCQAFLSLIFSSSC